MSMGVYREFENGNLVSFTIDGIPQKIDKINSVGPRLIYFRPGNILSAAIRKATGLGPCASGCRDCIDEMNRNGWFWCWRNRTVIAGRLAAVARARGHSITNAAALDFIKAAFRELATRRRNA